MVWDILTHFTYIRNINKLDLINQILAINELLPSHLISNAPAMYFSTLIHALNIYWVEKPLSPLGAQKVEKINFLLIVSLLLASKDRRLILWILAAVADYNIRHSLGPVSLNGDWEENQMFTQALEVAEVHIWVISTSKQIVWPQTSRHAYI